MAENSKIEWTDHTVNLWWGCAKVHTGCKNCYAETLSNRFDGGLWGENQPRKRIKSAFADLEKYQRKAEKDGVKVRVFVGSMMDIFEDSKPIIPYMQKIKGTAVYARIQATTSTLRDQLFSNISNLKYPNLVFLFLTKRPQNIEEMIPSGWYFDFPENVWFGTSVSDQGTADKYIQSLITHTPFEANRFISVEPQLDIIILQHYGLINWIIQGGESGSKKRPFNIDWARSMRDDCFYNGIPYFFKQIDKVQAIPEDLQVRQFPKF